MRIKGRTSGPFQVADSVKPDSSFQLSTAPRRKPATKSLIVGTKKSEMIATEKKAPAKNGDRANPLTNSVVILDQSKKQSASTAKARSGFRKVGSQVSLPKSQKAPTLKQKNFSSSMLEPYQRNQRSKASAAKQAPSKGKIDRFDVFETIGSGGYCKVKMGKDSKTGQKVALKVMSDAETYHLETKAMSKL